MTPKWGWPNLNSYALVFAIVFGIWLLLTASLSFPVLLIGIVVTYLGLRAFGSSSVFPIAGEPIRDLPGRVLTAILFIPVFIGEVFSSAIVVARLAYQPRPKMRPGVVRVKTILRSRTAITVLANLITLTPGTLTMDFDPDEWCYYVHWIDVTTLDEDERAELLIQRMEEYLRRILE